MEIPKNHFENLDWGELIVDGNEIKAIRGIDFKQLRHKELRTVCSRLKIKGVKNTSKQVMTQRIIDLHRSKEKYGKLTTTDYEEATTRKESQCAYRLMNILFSDRFAEQLAQLGNVANQILFDTGTTSNNQLFWEVVKEEFAIQDEAYDNLLFTDDEFLSDLFHIDPSKVVPHDWKKLRAIWKGLNTAYKAALSRFTLSSTQSSNFYEFCCGQQEIYYLRKHLESKPNLFPTIVTDPPEETLVESIEAEKKPPSTSNTPSKRKLEQDSEIVEALHELRNCRMQLELAIEKLETLQKQEAQKKQEKEHKEQEEECKNKEEDRKVREYCFDEWERILVNIRQLRNDMKNETDEELKMDIKADIEALLNRKKALANMLNFN